MRSIQIHKNPTADTRTCDYTKVTEQQLRLSSLQHISDVRQALSFFWKLLRIAGQNHDRDKITDIEAFHRDFVAGSHTFVEGQWHKNHIRLNRHHLTYPEGIPNDVNLIDVLDFIADCVMAGMARKGEVWPLSLPPELMEKAFQNTVELLKSNVEVVE